MTSMICSIGFICRLDKIGSALCRFSYICYVHHEACFETDLLQSRASLPCELMSVSKGKSYGKLTFLLAN